MDDINSYLDDVPSKQLSEPPKELGTYNQYEWITIHTNVRRQTKNEIVDIFCDSNQVNVPQKMSQTT